MPMNMTKLLEGMSKVGASDLHLKVGSKPTIRLHGVLRQIEHAPLSPDDTLEANNLMMPDRCRPHLEKVGSADYSYGVSGVGRFRVNVYHQRGSLSLAIRTIASAPQSFDELNLPASLEDMLHCKSGMCLVTGITGSGKSTTLAAMVNRINSTRREHIITIEDPIEYLYHDDKSVVEQVEVGSDIIDFPHALRSALRQDPDVILIGELRDRETVETAMHCVETGHLVLSTLHTPDAKQTMLRILHFFPIEDHPLINEQIALNLRGVCCQRLLRTVDGKGRVPACEILINTPIVKKLIREGRYDDIDKVMTGEEEGMQSFDVALVRLVKAEKITLDEALTVTGDEAALKRMLSGRMSGGDRRSILG